MGREHTVVLIVLAILGSSPFIAGLTAQDSRPPAQSGDAARGQTGKADSAPIAHMFFRDIASEVGVTTMPNSRTDRRYVLETMGGGGIALFDCDNDGKLDIAVVNDSTIEQYRKGGDLMITLYHQDGNSSAIHFTDITKASGLTTRGWGMAIAVGDYDNDGLPDLYVTGYGHNVLYHNLGNGKFENVTKKAGLERFAEGLSCTAGDYDNDGFTDLAVVLRDRILLLHNEKDGTFKDVTQQAGLATGKPTSKQVVAKLPGAPLVGPRVRLPRSPRSGGAYRPPARRGRRARV